MTQEDKKLLLKDLCARLPYGIWLSIKDTFKYSTYPHSNVWIEPCSFQNLYDGLKGSVKDKLLKKIFKERPEEYLEIKPYLRPMSSMTEEEAKELDNFHTTIQIGFDTSEMFDSVGYVDWLNAHHFDYRGLIEKGLALEAPEGMYEEI